MLAQRARPRFGYAFLSPTYPVEVTKLRRRGRNLELVTVAWNCVEAVVVIAMGAAAGSLALVGFGLDSCVEVIASSAVLWYMRGSAASETRRRARRAERTIAACFAALGVYLLVQAARSVLTPSTPEDSLPAVVFLSLTAVIMYCLAYVKRRIGRSLGNQPLLANASMTFLDGCLATGVLLALLGTQLLGWWWLDPAAAAVVAIVAFREARGNWRGQFT
ncbi:MAG: cobalt transporter [Streptosporangiales bacterium]|nr:cobalt transporter [Streptosporangiales bacterium]